MAFRSNGRTQQGFNPKNQRLAAYASVREMANKFEHLMQQQKRQKPKPPPKPTRVSQSTPVPATSRQLSSTTPIATSPAASGRSSRPSSVFYVPMPEVELRPKLSKNHRQHQQQHMHDDDLLFDNLITDISEYIAGHESTSRARSTIDDDTYSAATSASPTASLMTSRPSAAAPPTDSAAVTGVVDDSVIYQNIAAVFADKKRSRWVLLFVFVLQMICLVQDVVLTILQVEQRYPPDYYPPDYSNLIIHTVP